MPRFFIDTSDQDQFVRDEDGQDYLDVEAAMTAAIDALPDMAREALPYGNAHIFLAVVRGPKGNALLQASLSLEVTPLVENLSCGAAEFVRPWAGRSAKV